MGLDLRPELVALADAESPALAVLVGQAELEAELDSLGHETENKPVSLLSVDADRRASVKNTVGTGSGLVIGSVTLAARSASVCVIVTTVTWVAVAVAVAVATTGRRDAELESEESGSCPDGADEGTAVPVPTLVPEAVGKCELLRLNDQENPDRLARGKPVPVADAVVADMRPVPVLCGNPVLPMPVPETVP